ncbi:LOW QUALITY PROTEIN: uncharacterized protein EMH_0070820 [Eimeria mitis]|uniref:Transmembrane protein n=1 Tax=Eimeria mitis TaxID=44415 RepID=U6KDW6_9EIME|nr:LOW QUALITY PROTEIN: uncharacterized protein EMH_0070820 [Eimeria mitis]CDJ36225.1 hypothetical protein EMH_0070820 [Eimeria mitis]
MTPRYHPPNPDLQQSPGRLASHTPNTRHESVVSTSSSSHQFVVGAGRKPLEPRLSRGKCLASALASILSLVTILAVLALCRTSQRRLDSGGAVRRSLSDTEDDREQSEIVEQCLDLEQELGLPVAASAYGEEASEATSRIVAMLYDSAAAFEQMRVLGLQKRQDGAHSPPPKLPRLHQAGPPALYSQGSFGSFWPQSGGGLVESVVGALDADAWVTDDSELVFGEGEQQRHMAKPEEVPGLQRKVSSSQSYPLALYEGDSKPSAALSLGKPNSAEPGLSPKGWIDGS